MRHSFVPHEYVDRRDNIRRFAMMTKNGYAVLVMGFHWTGTTMDYVLVAAMPLALESMVTKAAVSRRGRFYEAEFSAA